MQYDPTHKYNRSQYIITQTWLKIRIYNNTLINYSNFEFSFLCLFIHLSSLKKWLIAGIISGGRVRRNLLSPCSAYFSPSSLLSNTPMLRCVLLILYIIQIKIITKNIHFIQALDYYIRKFYIWIAWQQF